MNKYVLLTLFLLPTVLALSQKASFQQDSPEIINKQFDKAKINSLSDPALAMAILDNLTDSLYQIEDSVLLFDLHYQYAVILNKLRGVDLNKTSQHVEQALSIATALKEEKKIYQAKSEKATLLLRIGNDKESVALNEEVVNYYTTEKEQMLLGEALLKKMQIQIQKRDFPEALKTAVNIANILNAIEQKESELWYQLRFHLGLLYTSDTQYQRGFKYFDEVIGYFESQQDVLSQVYLFWTKAYKSF